MPAFDTSTAVHTAVLQLLAIRANQLGQEAAVTYFDTYQSAPDQKLTPWQRGSIHVLAWMPGARQADIAAIFGVNQSTVSRIKRGRWYGGYGIVGVTKG